MLMFRFTYLGMGIRYGEMDFTTMKSKDSATKQIDISTNIFNTRVHRSKSHVTSPYVDTMFGTSYIT